ncbi:MAG: sialidase family protein [Gemmatimonas sp.]
MSANGASIFVDVPTILEGRSGLFVVGTPAFVNTSGATAIKVQSDKPAAIAGAFLPRTGETEVLPLMDSQEDFLIQPRYSVIADKLNIVWKVLAGPEGHNRDRVVWSRWEDGKWSVAEEISRTFDARNWSGSGVSKAAVVGDDALIIAANGNSSSTETYWMVGTSHGWTAKPFPQYSQLGTTLAIDGSNYIIGSLGYGVNSNVVRVTGSTDGGHTWSPLLQISSIGDRNVQQPSVLVLKEHRLIATWQSGENSDEIKSVTSDDGGATWQNATSLKLPGEIFAHQVAADSQGRIHAIATVTRGGRTSGMDVFYSVLEGHTWTVLWRTTRKQAFGMPGISTLSDGTIMVAWSEHDGSEVSPFQTRYKLFGSQCSG